MVDWGTMTVPALQANHSGFWRYMLERTEVRNQKLRDLGKEVPDAVEFALSMCQKNGETYYQQWLDQACVLQWLDQACVLQWSEDFLTWRQSSYTSMVEARAGIEVHMEYLGFDWSDREILRWVAKSQAIEPFDFDSVKGPKSVPDWALLKLSYDLHNAATRKAGARLLEVTR